MIRQNNINMVLTKKAAATQDHHATSMTSGLPGERLPMLKKMLATEKRIIRILETHSGLSGLIAEHAAGPNNESFDGMWSSSLTASTVRGMPDIEAVDTSARLAIVAETLATTKKPMIYDGDTGGIPEIFKFTVRSLEQLGVSAVIIEDKEGLKQNSLLAGSDALHHLCPIERFCEKIRAGVEASRSPDFMIIARMEALIAGKPMEEALSRAVASVNAGASGIMIHSRKKSPDEVLEFMLRFRATPQGISTPIVVVPSSYNTITEEELYRGGASICIYANQLLRAAYPAMLRTAESLLTHSRAYEVDSDLLPIKKIVNLIDHNGKAGHDVTWSSVNGNTSQKELIKPNKGIPNNSGETKSPYQLQEQKQKTLQFLHGMHLSGVPIRNEEHLLLDPKSNDVLNAPMDDKQVTPARMMKFLTRELGVNFFTGVPDSCIATFCFEIDQFCKNKDESNSMHVIAPNEGSSIALAIGNYLATGNVPVVYMQNSGLGNAVNPLLSAAHTGVYGIPMVLVIGWRGSPGLIDEPQHLVTGRQSRAILESLEVETFVLPSNDAEAEATMRAAHAAAKTNNQPVAVLVQPKTFSGKISRHVQPTELLSREAALSKVLRVIHPGDAVVATTGFTSRELYELRNLHESSHDSDFLCVGSMGHALSIAQGIAVAQPNRTVWCLDGDGAALMHLGSFAVSASLGLSNLRHVLFNNEAHESVGEQETAASQQNVKVNVENKHMNRLRFVELASSMGYSCLGSVGSADGLCAALNRLDSISIHAPTFLEVKITLGTRSNLGRPQHTTNDAKKTFMTFLAQPVPTRPEVLLKGCSEAGDSLLLTPGPLTTSPRVKAAMLHDYGSRDAFFIALTARVRQQLVKVVGGAKRKDDFTAVLLQGSGTFAVEAMIAQFVPRGQEGKLLILCNGAYGRRMATICESNARNYTLLESSENEPFHIDRFKVALDVDPTVTHVAVVSCETTTGVLNPVAEIAEEVARRGKRLLIDAMSSFGVIKLDSELVQFDAVAASSNKGLQGSPGLAFVIARKSALLQSATNSNSLVLDLHSQWKGFDATGEWRFTPPTHCLLALAEALDEFEAEGGVTARHGRYQANCKLLVRGMRDLGFETLIANDEDQAPVIVTFCMPTHPLFKFQQFYDRLSDKGYIIYPGKVATQPSFRVGCIGHVFPANIRAFCAAVQRTLQEMGISSLP